MTDFMLFKACQMYVLVVSVTENTFEDMQYIKILKSKWTVYNIVADFSLIVASLQPHMG